MLYLSQYSLSFSEARRLRLQDSYSLHKMVYDLFEDVRGGNSQEHSGILFVDKGGLRVKRVWILSDRAPRPPLQGELQTKMLPPAFLQFPHYDFEVVINPVRRNNQSGKLVPLRHGEDVIPWFCEKTSSWGFSVCPTALQVADLTVDVFSKGGRQVTLGKATLSGSLQVTDREKFTAAVSHGIGRGRAFGCGLLQIAPKH